MQGMRVFFIVVLVLLQATWAMAQTQTIRGTVLDKESKMSIIGATVVILRSNPLVGTTTDLDGKFKLSGVQVGRHDVQITYLGYEPVTMSALELTGGKELVLNVEMVEQVMKQAEVVVTADRQKQETMNTMTTVSARVFSTEEAERYAGSRNDVSRMATNFAGVRGANDATNDIVIRAIRLQDCFGG
jgi:hypothetical protein